MGRSVDGQAINPRLRQKRIRKDRDKRGQLRRSVHKETSQELLMLSRTLSDSQSLALYATIRVSQFVRNGQLCN